MRIAILLMCVLLLGCDSPEPEKTPEQKYRDEMKYLPVEPEQVRLVGESYRGGRWPVAITTFLSYDVVYTVIVTHDGTALLNGDGELLAEWHD